MPSTSAWHSIWERARSDPGAHHGKHRRAMTNCTLTAEFACKAQGGVSVGRKTGYTTNEYVLDLAATLPVVISDTEAVYLYGLDIIAQQQSERVYYVHDGLGSVRQLLDTTGDVETNYAYDPFGVPVVGGDVYNPYQFTGEAWDEEVGLLYLRARYYQPETGRFITKDPWMGDIWRPGTQNGYVYVQDNAVNYTDPSGLQGPGPVSNLWWLPPPPEPPIVSRSEWGALEPGIYTIGCTVVAWRAEGIYDPVINEEGYAYYSWLKPGESLADVLDTIVIHHEGNIQFYSVQMVQITHMFKEGHTDIGYHFAIGRYGTTYEGRGIGVRGVHVLGKNTGMIGVLMLGDFEPGFEIKGRNFPIDWDDPGPTAEQALSTISLIRWLDYLYGIDEVVGHGDVPGHNTVCPGENVMPYIPIFNLIAQER